MFRVLGFRVWGLQAFGSTSRVPQGFFGLSVYGFLGFVVEGVGFGFGCICVVRTVSI